MHFKTHYDFTNCQIGLMKINPLLRNVVKWSDTL